jgi:hypothetical protein
LSHMTHISLFFHVGREKGLTLVIGGPATDFEKISSGPRLYLWKVGDDLLTRFRPNSIGTTEPNNCSVRESWTRNVGPGSPPSTIILFAKN